MRVTRDPNWSPQRGSDRLMAGEFTVPDIWSMNRDGSNKTNLTNDARR